MNNPLFYSQVEKNDLNTNLIEKLSQICDNDSSQQLYIINSPLGEKYSYDLQENFIVVLSPKHKIMFFNLGNNSNTFFQYYEDFIEDLNSISDKFGYKNHLGRPRDWKTELTITIENNVDEVDLEQLFSESLLNNRSQRKCELLISLLIGSINDIVHVGVEVPESVLDKVKRNIILFDGDQTRFIYKEFHSKRVTIQGLSGTGKTELLMHKLKELYIRDHESKIFFTCHNIALANTLKSRVPSFFNFMKVEKQIEWYSRLWVDRAWGSGRVFNSGLYVYLCNYYSLPFKRFQPGKTDYKLIFGEILDYLNKFKPQRNGDFDYAFDYILIDERQDFPDVFFDLCEKITRRQIYIAGDIFQDIFENTRETNLKVDLILNRCYRTDPRTLMFAHAIGLGLFEQKKMNWFEDVYWNAIGYEISRNGETVSLSREPIRRFENLDQEMIESVIIKDHTNVPLVIQVIEEIRASHETVTENDIAIIILDDNQHIYTYIDNLSAEISSRFNWHVNRAYESKSKMDGALFITNPNNVKGLEFPFVICITGSIKDDYRYRNILYTMLTRSFIQSYLMVQNNSGLSVQTEGLKTINSSRKIITKEPTVAEKIEIKNTLIQVRETQNISYKDFIKNLLDELKIDPKYWSKFEKVIMTADIEKFDEELTRNFIEKNREFYCK